MLVRLEFKEFRKAFLESINQPIDFWGIVVFAEFPGMVLRFEIRSVLAFELIWFYNLDYVYVYINLKNTF